MTDTAQRDYWVTAGITVTATAAALVSFSFLVTLAHEAGWPGPVSVPLPTTFMLPLTIDALAVTAWRVYWATRRPFAWWAALGATAGSAVGQSAGHAFLSGLAVPGFRTVVLVGAVPAVSLALVMRLAAIRRETVAGHGPVTVPREPGDGGPARTYEQPEGAADTTGNGNGNGNVRRSYSDVEIAALAQRARETGLATYEELRTLGTDGRQLGTGVVKRVYAVLHANGQGAR